MPKFINTISGLTYNYFINRLHCSTPDGDDTASLIPCKSCMQLNYLS